jgi:GH24 family phage-related lysozyme (muramidase)
MTISDAGVALVEKHEGFRAQVYKDGAGYPTIGYGHRLKGSESFPNGITLEQGTALLKQDLQTAENAVNTLVKVSLTQPQFDALVDFTYNVGAGNLEASTLLTKLNKGDYSAVPSEFVKWVYAGGKVEPGLVARRQDEARMWETAAA